MNNFDRKKQTNFQVILPRQPPASKSGKGGKPGAGEPVIQLSECRFQAAEGAGFLAPANGWSDADEAQPLGFRPLSTSTNADHADWRLHEVCKY